MIALSLLMPFYFLLLGSLFQKWEYLSRINLNHWCLLVFCIWLCIRQLVSPTWALTPLSLMIGKCYNLFPAQILLLRRIFRINTRDFCRKIHKGTENFLLRVCRSCTTTSSRGIPFFILSFSISLSGSPGITTCG